MQSPGERHDPASGDAAALTDSSAWREELSARRERAHGLATAVDAEALLVFGCDRHGQAFRYLTGFEPVLGDMWLLLTDATRCVMTFQWQIAEARRMSGIERWEAAFDPVPLVAQALHEARVRRVAVVGLERMPVTVHAALLASVPALALVDVGAEAVALRQRKSPLEVARLRAAARVTDQMLDAAREHARPGVTENELVAEISRIPLVAGGAHAFEPSVIGGVDDPIPIRRPTDRPLRAGDTVMVDVGAEIDGYQADATRTFVLGAASREQRRAWDVVRRAYDAACSLARPGVACRELHLAASAVIEEAGYSVAHRVGHGIGLATSFEWPSLDTETAPLQAGVTICVEPGVYAPGAGNVKLEDDLLITDSGFELLTHSDSTLEVSV